MVKKLNIIENKRTFAPRLSLFADSKGVEASNGTRTIKISAPTWTNTAQTILMNFWVLAISRSERRTAARTKISVRTPITSPARKVT